MTTSKLRYNLVILGATLGTAEEITYPQNFTEDDYDDEIIDMELCATMFEPAPECPIPKCEYLEINLETGEITCFEDLDQDSEVYAENDIVFQGTIKFKIV